MLKGKLVILDLDGVLYKPRASELDVSSLWSWATDNFSACFIYTNDVTYSCTERQSDCRSFGAKPSLNQIITPVDIVYDAVLPRLFLQKPYLIGVPTQFVERHRFREAYIENADCLLIGDLTGFSNMSVDQKLTFAREKIPIFLLNGNMSNTSPECQDIGHLAYHALKRSGVSALLVGKPSWLGFQHILKKNNCNSSEALFITDHLLNDAVGSILGCIPTLIIDGEGYWSNWEGDTDNAIRSFIRSPHRRKRSMWE